MVNASTTSTSEARKAAVAAGRMLARGMDRDRGISRRDYT